MNKKMRFKVPYRHIILVSCAFVFVFSEMLHATISPGKLTCEYLHNPQVIDVINPRLSWVNVESDGKRGQLQTAYEIRVAQSKQLLQKGIADLWDTGKVNSNQSVNLVYKGKPLISRQDCWWQVRVWDKNGKVSGWSEPAFWSMGLLNPEEWQAQWIGAPWQGEEALPKPDGPINENELPPASPILRKSFIVDGGKEIASARVYITGLGYFELYLNGRKVSDDVFVPNLTLYGKRPDLENNGLSLMDNFKEYRVMYLSYDVTSQIQQGENVIGAMLGNGFYNAPRKWTHSYGSPRFLGQLYISYTDGTEEVIVSDSSWKIAKGPVIMDLVYDGEYYDARKEQSGWCTSGFDDSKWAYSVIRKAPEGKLKAHMSPVDKVMESLPAIKVEKLDKGYYRIDFGQEISGWLRLKDIYAPSGHKIDIKYISESPVGKNYYICNGKGSESYAARFTWFVFREAEITNWPGELKPEQLVAEAVYSNIETTGKFECSNHLFNDIHKIWWRSQTDNMHGGIASDCPHRERSPYTGDGQAACVTVMHNFDAGAFYTKWIQDILGAQNPETGYVPNGAPWQPGCGGGVAWGAAMIIMPWEFYVHYGDIDMLKRNFNGMKEYVRYMLTWTDENGIMHSQAPDKKNPNEWLNLGDWVAPDKLPPDDMVHTFYLWRCADLTARTALILGDKTASEEYAVLANNTRNAFQHKFYNEHKCTYGPFGGNIFALKMGIPEDQKAKVIASLKADIAANDGHLDTGIFGTQFFFEVLSENGLHELAYEAMNKHTQPSYGWWIEQGATTTWEQWNGENSHNHPMFGGGIVWFYRKLSGMSADPERPGYKHIFYNPQPVGDVMWASYANETPFGRASIHWIKRNHAFILNIIVPVGSTGTVYIPAREISAITEGGRPINKARGVTLSDFENNRVVCELESGYYSFISSE